MAENIVAVTGCVDACRQSRACRPGQDDRQRRAAQRVIVPDISPPWACAISREIASPSPVPPFWRRLRLLCSNLSNTLNNSASGIPTPLSVTTMDTAASALRHRDQLGIADGNRDHTTIGGKLQRIRQQVAHHLSMRSASIQRVFRASESNGVCAAPPAPRTRPESSRSLRSGRTAAYQTNPARLGLGQVQQVIDHRQQA